MDLKELSRKTARLFDRYKYALIVVAVGIVLLVWPSGAGAAETPAAPTGLAAAETGFSVTELETRLSEALSEAQGVGRTRVLLTLKTDMEVLLSKDERESQRRDMEDGELRTYDYETESKTVMSGASGGSAPVVVGRVYPEFKGALVVCEGAGDAAVRLRVVEAVAAVTGLGADKITVVAMKTN
ncbi:MAG: stage III sporulation protein AG [Oscillospiraceae bacterium]|jgi:stage III sporulation protein AG|nr:stage III sporulation protein AG [Oscillospiraceae bacterium]